MNIEYDELGYVEKVAQKVDSKKNQQVTVAEKSINNVIVIPSIEGIVVGKDSKYGIVNKIGKVIIPCEFDKIYSITNEGEDEIYLEKGNRVYELMDYLRENRIDIETSAEEMESVYSNEITNETSPGLNIVEETITPTPEVFSFVID